MNVTTCIHHLKVFDLHYVYLSFHRNTNREKYVLLIDLLLVWKRDTYVQSTNRFLFRESKICMKKWTSEESGNWRSKVTIDDVIAFDELKNENHQNEQMKNAKSLNWIMFFCTKIITLNCSKQHIAFKYIQIGNSAASIGQWTADRHLCVQPDRRMKYRSFSPQTAAFRLFFLQKMNKNCDALLRYFSDVIIIYHLLSKICFKRISESECIPRSIVTENIDLTTELLAHFE